jgi:hypothetical protein
MHDDDRPLHPSDNLACVDAAVQAVNEAMACLASTDVRRAIGLLRSTARWATELPEGWQQSWMAIMTRLELLIIAEPLWRATRNALSVTKGPDDDELTPRD